VRAFFDNGGKRAFISRVAGTGAERAVLRVSQGIQLRLARAARQGEDVVFLTSLSGIKTGVAAIEFHRASDGGLIGAAHDVTSYDTRAGSVKLTTALAATDVLPSGALEPGQVFAVPAGSTLSAAAGPEFHARNVGAWGRHLKVLITSANRPPTPIAVGAATTDTIIQVTSTSSFYRGAIVEIDHGSPAQRSYRTVEEILPGNRLRLDAALGAAATTGGFASVAEIDVTVEEPTSATLETFKGLSWNPANDTAIRLRHYSTTINTRSRLVYVRPPGFGGLGGSESFDIADQPITDRASAMSPLAADSGADGSPPTAIELVGADGGPSLRTGVQSLQDVEDIRIIAAPGYTDPTTQTALITQAERMQYRFAVLDAEREPQGPSVVNSILTHRNAYDSSFAAYYTPWPTIVVGDRTIDLPPSGYVMGVYARTDNERGVHKAPANEVVNGITGLTLYITTGEQDLLNPRGVNAIRRFEGRGIRVWGARTTSSNQEVKYVNVRRLLIFIEASIDRGTNWVVFEPNAPDTWTRVVDTVSAFLHTQWQSGALFGRRPEDAFRVRCDETTMSVDDIQNGRLICEIGVAIVRPAEFVIFRIEQITGFATRT
jgi:hypothetical protein